MLKKKKINNIQIVGTAMVVIKESPKIYSLNSGMLLVKRRQFTKTKFTAQGFTKKILAEKQE